MLKLQKTMQQWIRVHASNDKDRPQHSQHCMPLNMHKSMQIFMSCNCNVIEITLKSYGVLFFMYSVMVYYGF